MLKISLIAITPPSIQTGTCCLSALLLEAIRERLTASDLASFFPYEQPQHTPLVKPLSFLRKYRIRTEEMNFIAPFSLLCVLTKAPHSPSATSAPLLLKKRKGKWILQPLVLSVSSDSTPPPPHLPPIWSGTLRHSPSFSLLNTKIGNEFYCLCPFFSPQHHPLVTHPHCSYCLSPLQP